MKKIRFFLKKSMIFVAENFALVMLIYVIFRVSFERAWILLCRLLRFIRKVYFSLFRIRSYRKKKPRLHHTSSCIEVYSLKNHHFEWILCSRVSPSWSLWTYPNFIRLLILAELTLYSCLDEHTQRYYHFIDSLTLVFELLDYLEMVDALRCSRLFEAKIWFYERNERFQSYLYFILESHNVLILFDLL